jgi:uncharacterized protein HemY
VIRTFIIFLLLLGSVWLGVQLHQDSGYVLIALNDWTIEATVLTTLTTLLIIFLILHLGLITLNWMIKIPQRFHYWRLKRKAQKIMKKQQKDKIHELKNRISFETTAEGYFILGQLLDEVDDHKSANLAYKEGLKRALGI